ncbi:15991_t:CDS:2 [Acaulospora morrowiae]|uniref:15991_t:CDS:1 n=1 Tax=Acaulospora morrowiae TaxID=94023 RepID=A0A9N8VJA1_9GLOM|nr:15991_t:CDS:2 [Acaulospora morrowiae]
MEQGPLTQSLQPTTLEIVNESSLHANHYEMKDVDSRETHFRVSVVSENFEGKSLLQRHQIIYKLLDEELKAGLHALSIKAKTPKEMGQ